MGIMVYRDQTSANAAAATLFAAQIIEKPDSVLGLTAGAMTEGVYARLVGMTGSGMLDWSDITVFNMYEYVGIPQDHRKSAMGFLKHHLIGKVNLRSSRIHTMNGTSQDVNTATMRYEETIIDSGGLDMVLVNLGMDGHLAFNEPSRQFSPMSHCVSLSQSSLEESRAYFSDLSEAPGQVMAMGIGTIMSARKVVLVAYGSAIADTVYRMIQHAITPSLPASVLQMHQNVIYILDESAAARL